MALNGVGGGDAGSALERFQAIRDSAKKKLAGADGQASLADLIKRKQSELGTGSGAAASAAGLAARTSAERIPSKPAAPPIPGNAAPAGAQGATGSSAYGRSGGLQKQDPKPTLGRHVDFMA
jgi:hypothetical protein